MPEPEAGISRPIRVLHLEDDPRDAELIRQKLRADGLACDIVWADRKEAFETTLAHGAFDLVIADYNLPDYDAWSALARVREKQPELPVIVVSGTVGEEEAVECLKAGATDYVLKQRPQRLGAAVTRALRDAEQRQKRRATEEALRESEERFRVTFEQAAVGMALRDIDPRQPRWLRVNQKLCDILGYTQEELLQLTSVDITPPGERDLAIDHNEKMLRGELASYSREKRYMRKDGRIIWVNLSVTAVRGPDGNPTHVISVIEDITGRKEAEDKIRRLNRVYAVLSGINALIVRVRDRQELLNEACRIAVEQGKFGIAWIGACEPPGQDVTPIAWAGIDAETVAKSTSSVRAGTPEREGVTGRAVMQKQAVVNNDITAELEFGSERRRAAIRLGYRSAIGLPLVVDGQAIGALTLYAKEPNFFNEEELKLLNELVEDISFAIAHNAQQEKLEKLSRVRAVSSEINAAIVRIHERERLLHETYRIAHEQGKFDMIWIGAIDSEKMSVRPVAWSGFSAEAVHAVSWATISGARGTLGEAIRTRRVAFRRDIEAELPAGKLRDEALKQGCHSTACLPLVVDDNVVAAIVLFGAGQGFFDEDEVKLLNEVASDISFALQSIAQQEKVEYLSYYDALTGLPNRHLFVDRLNQQMCSRSDGPQMVALVLLDLDRFRNINESFGHRGGDEILRTVARRLEHTFRGKDYLARISSNGFGAIVRGIRDAPGIVHVIESNVFGCFGEPFLVSDTELRPSATAGIAVFPADGQDAHNLFRNAESALKRAKASGDRYLFYAAEMNAAAAGTLLLETKMRRALENEQFVLHYQPKVNLTDGEVSGLEALIRWNDPDSGLVPPGRFIPVLEETGLIIEVGRWAICQAVKDYRQWYREGLQPTPIAVNVSAIQFKQKDFVEVVHTAIGEATRGGHGLDLEITESVIMENIEENTEKLRSLKNMGIKLSIDDFGTGYSSLGYLAKLPLDALKIDRSFIVTMAENPDSMAIVSTIISLAHSFDLKVIAEGVETEEQSRFLKLLKCDEIQGYFISKPMPASELAMLLRDSTRARQPPSA